MLDEDEGEVHEFEELDGDEPMGEDEDDSNVLPITRKQIEFAVTQLPLLLVMGTCTVQCKDVARALIAHRHTLRSEGHGTKVRHIDRCEMQGAWEATERLDTHLTVQPDAQPTGWLHTTWLPTEHDDWYFPLLRTEASTLGWLVKQLLSKQRLAAAGGSAIGAKRSLPVHKELRARQKFDTAFEKFHTLNGGRFSGWSILEFERMLVWGAVERQIPEWGGPTEGSVLYQICLEAACFYGEALYFALLVGGTPTPCQANP